MAASKSSGGYPWIHQSLLRFGGSAVDIDENAKQRVIIIGSGITGLLCAQGLLEAGIPFSIWEAEESVDNGKSGDWSMAIHWALPQLKSILGAELFDRIQEVQTDQHYSPPEKDLIPIYHGVSGELLKGVPMDKWHRVTKSKMRGWLAELSTGNHVQCSKRLTEVQYSENGNFVTAKFADGTKIIGTSLLGADGPRSRVRQLLLGIEKSAPKAAPYVATRTILKYPTAEQALHARSGNHINAMAIHPDGIWTWISVIDVPDPNIPETWTFQLMTSWRKPNEEDVFYRPTLSDVKARTGKFAEPFRSANAWMPRDQTVYANRVTYWEPIPWDNHQGRISLAGDAVHPMTFHRGQGLNHAIADAERYVAALCKVNTGKDTLKEAISAYDAEVIARGGEEVKISRLNTEMIHQWDKLMQSPLMTRGVVQNLASTV